VKAGGGSGLASNLNFPRPTCMLDGSLHQPGSGRCTNTGARAPEPTVSDVARAALAEVEPSFITVRAEFGAGDIVPLPRVGFIEARDAILSRSTAHPARIVMGLKITGAEVEEVARRAARHQFPGFREETIIQVQLEAPFRAATVAIRFKNGDGTIVAALRNFVGNVFVKDGLVSNVSYDRGEIRPVTMSVGCA
jgi:hypothetical protein